MNNIIRELTSFNIKNIKSAFTISKQVFTSESDGKLFHAAEFGGYRENLITHWLKLYLPEKYGISSGFVITPTNKISTQCDLVIYHKDCAPVIDNNNQRFFPIESVVGVGEIKSDIQSPGELNEALRKLGRVKLLRTELDKIKSDLGVYERNFERTIQRSIDLNPGKFNAPQEDVNNFKKVSFRGNPYDNMFTFLLCNKFAFDYLNFKFDYQDVESHFWHNSILSMHDGLFSYISPGNTPHISFPATGDLTHRHYFTPSKDEPIPPYIRIFLSKFYTGITNTTVFEFDMLNYLSPENEILNDFIT